MMELPATNKRSRGSGWVSFELPMYHFLSFLTRVDVNVPVASLLLTWFVLLHRYHTVAILAVRVIMDFAFSFIPSHSLYIMIGHHVENVKRVMGCNDITQFQESLVFLE